MWFVCEMFSNPMHQVTYVEKGSGVEEDGVTDSGGPAGLQGGEGLSVLGMSMLDMVWPGCCGHGQKQGS